MPGNAAVTSAAYSAQLANGIGGIRLDGMKAVEFIGVRPDDERNVVVLARPDRRLWRGVEDVAIDGGTETASPRRARRPGSPSGSATRRSRRTCSPRSERSTASGASWRTRHDIGGERAAHRRSDDRAPHVAIRERLGRAVAPALHRGRGEQQPVGQGRAHERARVDRLPRTRRNSMTRALSPPNAAMLSCTHCRASSASSRPWIS